MNDLKRYRLSILTGFLLLSGPLWASDPEAAEGSLEEVVVIADHSPSILLKQIYRTQEDIFDRFNEANTDDRFDMVCKKEAYIGSQIRYTRCRPRFLRQAVSLATEDTLADGLYGVPDLDRATMRKLESQQRELMAELAGKDPEFLALLKKRHALRQAYEAATGSN